MKKLKLEACSMCPYHKVPPHLNTAACSKMLQEIGEWKPIDEDEIRIKVYYEEGKYFHNYQGVFPTWCPLEGYE